MLSLRSLANIAAVIALAAVGLTLGTYLRDPHPGGLAFVLLVAAIVGALLWRLYRPGGVARPERVGTGAEPERAAEPAAQASAPTPPAAAPAPAPTVPGPAPAPAAAATTTEPAAPSPAARPAPEARPARTGRPRAVPASARKLLVPGLALAAVIIGVVALIASSGSDSSRKTAAAPTPAPAPKAQTAPKPRAKPKPTRAKPKAKPRPAAKRPAASAKSLGSGTLQTGSKGVDVKLLQKLLKVQVSGTFGPKTEAAVRAFQGKHHLPPTGVVATLTHKALKKAFP